MNRGERRRLARKGGPSSGVDGMSPETLTNRILTRFASNFACAEKEWHGERKEYARAKAALFEWLADPSLLERAEAVADIEVGRKLATVSPDSVVLAVEHVALEIHVAMDTLLALDYEEMALSDLARKYLTLSEILLALKSVRDARDPARKDR